MKRIALVLSVAMAATALPVVAFAQDEGAAPAVQETVIYKKNTNIDFSDVTLEGELSKPQGSYVSSRKKSSFMKLIRVREDFVPEMEKSVDNL